MSTDLKSLSPDEARHQAACSALPITTTTQHMTLHHAIFKLAWEAALAYAAAHGYVPPAPPKPEIRRFDLVRDENGVEGVVGGFLPEFERDPAEAKLYSRDGGLIGWRFAKSLVLVARPTWAPVEQSDR